jgi:hypothetical protein
MKRVRYIIAAALVAFIATAAVAFASQGSDKPSHAGKAKTHLAEPAEAATPDTDNIQEGDQTSPDKPKAAATRTAKVKASNVALTTAAEAETEPPESETGSESESPSDGPGGHEDPPGDVNHEFEGEE